MVEEQKASNLFFLIAVCTLSTINGLFWGGVLMWLVMTTDL